MRINGGPTDLAKSIEFTNWDEVGRFAGRISELVAKKGVRQ
jgi:menaquinone-dependent protoporphyrinogen IX oxidase